MRLRLPAETISFVSHLPPALKQKVRAGFDCLLDNPSEGKALRAELQGLRSLRIGRFRIIYRIADKILEIVAVGPRSTIYQEIAERLAMHRTIGARRTK